MAKIEKIAQEEKAKERVVKTKLGPNNPEDNTSFKWWLAGSPDQLSKQLLSTTAYLKKTSQVRIRQASIYSRLFSGKPLYNYLANIGTLDNSQQLPIGRPTANVVYSCTDTLVSRLTMDKPRPVFLTDNGHYKERTLAKQMNNFIMGEFYRTGAYQLGALALRDSCVLADGLLKVFPQDNKVCVERVLPTEILVDYNDGYYGQPRSMIHMKLVDRGTMLALFPEAEKVVEDAQHGNVDNTPLSTQTVVDQFIISEAWHLPSSKDSKDGRHVIVCSSGVILDEPWTKDYFPFVKIGYNPNIVNYFSQGLAEILFPTQMEIYKLLIVASQAIELMGVPRILIDEMSKILETAFNNNIGSIIKYRGTAPIFQNAQANHPEIYEWIKFLIQNAFQMSGISQMSAAAQKPAGLDSGEAIRTYDALQTDRFAALQRRYQDMYTELAYRVIDCASDIAEETGSYMTCYPDKDGTREVELPKAGILKDTYIIQCFEESSLPRDPAGRQAKLSEMLAAGEITQQEFRRLSSFPDLQQADSLANALEERILYTLDKIVEKGRKEYESPDSFMLDPTDLATQLVVNYINKYSVTDIEEDKLQLLRDWFTQLQLLKQGAQPPQPMQGAPAQQQQPAQPPAPTLDLRHPTVLHQSSKPNQ